MLLAACAPSSRHDVAVRAAPSPEPSIDGFDRVVIVVLENREYSNVMGNSEAPFVNRLAHRFSLATRFFGIRHPSLPNYLALIGGSTFGIDSDCTDCSVDARNLADTLTAAKKTWKTYAEGLPGPGFTGATAGRYAKKHNPFLYFESVVSNPAQRNRVVPLTELATDLAAGRLPDFALIIPDLCSDMHDCPVATGDAWLGRVTKPLLASPELERSVIFVVFDEGESEIGGGGEIAALALGPAVRRGSEHASLVNHYSLLRTIEDAWGLPKLGASVREQPITGIWR